MGAPALPAALTCLDESYEGPLPEQRVGAMLDLAARRRTAAAQRFLDKVCKDAGVPGVTFGGFARRGAYYDYGKRQAFISRQVLAFGSPRLIGFILAHEIGHATQIVAKRRVLMGEQLTTIALACWVAASYLPTSPVWLNAPLAFFIALLATVLGLRLADVWWEIDADKKARQWTGFTGSLRMIFDEFLAVESTCRENWQSRIRAKAAELLWTRAG